MGAIKDLLTSYDTINNARSLNTPIQKLFTIDNKAIVYKNSLTLIQGKMGSHKSRLAEMMICSLLRDSIYTKKNLKLISKVVEYKVLYIDTERPSKSQFPDAINRVYRLAGMDKLSKIWNIKYQSFSNVTLSQRSDQIKSLLTKYIRSPEFMDHIIFLDVLSDCVEDFNSSSESLKLIGMLNKLVNEYNCTIVCVLHENPNKLSDKPRGHLGTELQNKASTVLRMVSSKSGIKLIVKKSRFSKSGVSFDLEFNEKQECLKLMGNSYGYTFENAKVKAPEDDLRSFLLDQLIGQKMYKPEFIRLLKDEFDVGTRTIESRINKILKSSKPMVDANGDEYRLCIEKDGRKNIYYLEEF